jgi:hypothetical protein
LRAHAAQARRAQRVCMLRDDFRYFHFSTFSDTLPIIAACLRRHITHYYAFSLIAITPLFSPLHFSFR